MAGLYPDTLPSSAAVFGENMNFVLSVIVAVLSSEWKKSTLIWVMGHLMKEGITFVVSVIASVIVAVLFFRMEGSFRLLATLLAGVLPLPARIVAHPYILYVRP